MTQSAPARDSSFNHMHQTELADSCWGQFLVNKGEIVTLAVCPKIAKVRYRPKGFPQFKSDFRPVLRLPTPTCRSKAKAGKSTSEKSWSMLSCSLCQLPCLWSGKTGDQARAWLSGTCRFSVEPLIAQLLASLSAPSSPPFLHLFD